ncbi:MAG: hypothetical protein MUO62_00095 [Anaerolineales bacterium]|jgi:hypothetical protein|nr:hypothetical protein [Anaerolineales bacterium]
MEEKITIIEGPPPTFEAIPDLWVHGLTEGMTQTDIVVTHLRTFNGSALVERCYQAWQNQKNIKLEYRTPEGLPSEVPIVAARNVITEEGDMLMLWLRLTDDAIELEIGYDDDSGDEEDEDWDLDNLS